MKNKLILYFSIILTLVLSPIVFTYAQNISSTTEIQALQATIEQLKLQIKSLEAQMTELKSQLQEIKIELKLTKTLYKGITDNEVRQLQEFLKQYPDIYPEGLVTGYFGSLTEAAVKRLQEQQGIEPIGIVGPKTREKLNAIAVSVGATQAVPSTGAGTPAIPAIPATPATPATPHSVSNTSTVPATPATPATPAIPATPTCSNDSWNCSNWAPCSSAGLQIRNCYLAYDCPSVYTVSPSTTQNCTPQCTSDSWDCSNWNQCSINGSQSRSCSLSFDCPNANTPSPSTTQNCIPQCTSDTWSCSDWSQCSMSGSQSRSCTLVSDCSLISTPSPATTQSCTPPGAAVVVEDDFNSYSNGSIVGQGNWSAYTGGYNFAIQGSTIFEGSKAIYNNSSGDSVIFKQGNYSTDGRQTFYIKTENRSNWGTDAEAQVRVSKGPWENSNVFCAVTFEKNGNVGYSIGNNVRTYFATYNDNEWIKLEIEWRSVDKKARYRINNGTWTNWDFFWGSANFINFDYVGLDFDRKGGSSGGVYFDTLAIDGPVPTQPSISTSILQDDFNSYANGSIVGQGGWNAYTGGYNFTVQGATVYEGAKAIYCNTQADNVIYKLGTPLSDGRQAVYIKTENRANWGDYWPGNAQVRISKGSWQGSELRNFVLVTFKRDGNVSFYNKNTDTYTNFATYNDNEWTLLEIEWRASDKTARFRVNNGVWTDWSCPFTGSGTFTDFDTVGFDFDSPGGGSGGVYYDALY